MTPGPSAKSQRSWSSSSADPGSAAIDSLTEPMRKQLASRFSQVDGGEMEDDAERLDIP